MSSLRGPFFRYSLCVMASRSAAKPAAACDASCGTCWMSSAAAWLSAPATTAKKTSRPTVAAREEGKRSVRRIHDTRGSSRTVIVSAIATGMMTSVSLAAPHRIAATSPTTTRVRQENAAATRRVRGTRAAASPSSVCSSRTDRRTGAGSEFWAAFFAGSAALSRPIRSDSFQRGCWGASATGSPFLTPLGYPRSPRFPPLTRLARAGRALGGEMKA